MNVKRVISWFSLSTLSFLGFSAILPFSLAYAGGGTVITVTPNDLDNTSSNPAVVATDGLNKWFLYNDTNDTIDNTLGSFVLGPATPPFGQGSVQFTLGASPMNRKNIATYQFSGKSLASITSMSFSAYSHSGVAGPNESPFLNFNVDFTGSSSSFQRRLVYVPSANGPVTQDAWWTYDVINGGNALWTWSGYASHGNTWPDGNPNEYRKWSDIMTAFPNARFLPVGGWLGIRVGEPGPTNYTANVDSFAIGTASGTTYFDFEPLVGPPTMFSECEKNGWKTFNNPSFKNKEKCEKYVKENMHTIKGNDVVYTANGLKREVDMDMSTAEEGSFEYDDAAKGWYNVKISSVTVAGNMGWFAGKVVKASNPAWVGLWLFGKVQDGTPDMIWGSFTDETTAKNGVSAMSNPADGPFTVTKKDIKVK